ncbi:MAG: SEL1-like repeat protein, partial [Victivallales bacterium]|nr:SEL1-like repeat protein [Victivallales bacterium]
MAENLYSEILDNEHPNHYHLLCLKLFESNQEVIHQAGLRQMKKLKAWDLHEDKGTAAQVREMHVQLSCALATLEDPEKKSAYDKTLAEKLGTINPYERGKSTAADFENKCPACGVQNATDARFCVGCGESLFQPCLECGRETLNCMRFCPQCGTDNSAFTTIAGIVANIKDYHSKRNWESVVEEASKLPKDAKVTGKKGVRLMKTASKLTNEAIGHIEAIPRLEETIQVFLEEDDYEPAMRLVGELDARVADPSETEKIKGIILDRIEETKRRVRESLEQRAFNKLLLNIQALQERNNIPDAISLCQEWLSENPHANDARLKQISEIIAFLTFLKSSNDKALAEKKRKLLLLGVALASITLLCLLLFFWGGRQYKRNETFKAACYAGEAAMRLSDYQTAKAQFERALKIKPRHSATLARLRSAIEHEERHAEAYWRDIASGKIIPSANEWAKAEQAMLKAARHGEAEAQCFLGDMYFEGNGVSKNLSEAFLWYRKAAELGLAVAQNNLGVMYANGKGLAKDEAQAAVWYRKAAEQGLAMAQSNLGSMYFDGRGVAKDEAQAAVWYRKAAEKGSDIAQFNLGNMYSDGCGVAKDEVQAFFWYCKAAKQGLAMAQNSLGSMYSDGRGVAKDEAHAVFWCREAAEQGYPPAQSNLGSMYSDGRGVAKDEVQALFWYRKAAKQGYADAQYNLGLMYKKGRGVARDDVQAAAWFRKAAEQGLAMAQNSLGSMYSDGRGVAKDQVQAFLCFRKAAEQGYADAQYNLGLMYKKGRGVARDDV